MRRRRNWCRFIRRCFPCTEIRAERLSRYSDRPLNIYGTFVSGNPSNGNGCANRQSVSHSSDDHEQVQTARVDYNISQNDTTWFRFQVDTCVQAAYTDPINSLFDSVSPVSLRAAWAARSPALLAFGGDSAVELLSATVVLWRFRAHPVQEQAERRASRIAGILLFVLAAYVAAAAALTLLGYSEPKPTYLGIAILMAAAAIMPWIAKGKRRLFSATDSAALRVDSAQSALCAYLSLIALVGLGVNTIWHVPWT